MSKKVLVKDRPNLSKLIRTICKIDPDAAAYLRYIILPISEWDSKQLISVSCWCELPQGHKYWATICDKLPEGLGW